MRIQGLQTTIDAVPDYFFEFTFEIGEPDPGSAVFVSQVFKIKKLDCTMLPDDIPVI